jgi:hypothetical protein
MAIKVNGKDMKDAVIKTDQFEMLILELTPNAMKVSVKDIQGESFSFVPRFISVVYPDKTINAKDNGIVVVPSKETVSTTVQFQEKLRMEAMMLFELRYARKKLATISVD